MKPWFQKESDLGAAFTDYYKRVSEGHCLDKKTAELIAIAVASVLRCTHCTQAHMRKAGAAGATAREITDALLLSSLVAGAAQLFWDRENFEKAVSAQAAGAGRE